MSNRIADNWDRVLSSSPLNATASAVTGTGEHYDYELDATVRHWKAPPPYRAPTHLQKPLMGHRQGRLTVLGVWGRDRAKGTLWLVRCACGDYEVRPSKTVLTPNDNAKCDVCQHLDWLQHHEAFLRTKKGQAWSLANVKPLMKETA